MCSLHMLSIFINRYPHSSPNLKLSEFRIKDPPGPSKFGLGALKFKVTHTLDPSIFCLGVQEFHEPPTPSYISWSLKDVLWSWKFDKNFKDPFYISCLLKFGLCYCTTKLKPTILRSLQLHLLSLKVWSWKVSRIRNSQLTSRGCNQFLDHKRLR
jgi:hypothetical protein